MPRANQESRGITVVLSVLSRLPNLGERLQMPDGWAYRVRTPDHDLVVKARDGVAHVVLDEFENNYQRAD